MSLAEHGVRTLQHQQLASKKKGRKPKHISEANARRRRPTWKFLLSTQRLFHIYPPVCYVVSFLFFHNQNLKYVPAPFYIQRHPNNVQTKIHADNVYSYVKRINTGVYSIPKHQFQYVPSKCSQLPMPKCSVTYASVYVQYATNKINMTKKVNVRVKGRNSTMTKDKHGG
jgi:hypothetical protein